MRFSKSQACGRPFTSHIACSTQGPIGPPRPPGEAPTGRATNRNRPNAGPDFSATSIPRPSSRRLQSLKLIFKNHLRTHCVRGSWTRRRGPQNRCQRSLRVGCRPSGCPSGQWTPVDRPAAAGTTKGSRPRAAPSPIEGGGRTGAIPDRGLREGCCMATGRRVGLLSVSRKRESGACHGNLSG